MSRPVEPNPVKLIASLFSPEKDLLERAISEMTSIAGPTDWISPELMFDRTRYYAKEMGWPLHRRFVSFQDLIAPHLMVETKLASNEMEKRFTSDGKRRVNIDPGCVSAERLILATGKNYIHRVYLGKGIYGDLTLIFKRGTYVPLEWTYPDYRAPETISLFNGIRTRYMEQLAQARAI